MLTKTLLALCLSAIALADIAAPAAPANFCRRLEDRDERERCQADRLN